VHRHSAALLLIAFAGTLPAQAYVVVACTGRSPEDTRLCAGLIAEAREGCVVPWDGSDFELLCGRLRAARASRVAVVIPEEDLDWSFARRFLAMSTQVDSDPFVDFEFGFITAGSRTGFLDRWRAAARTGQPACARRLTTIGVWEGPTTSSRKLGRMGGLHEGDVQRIEWQIADGRHFPEQGRDLEFLERALGSLAGNELVMLAGHGLPSEILGGPRARDLDRANFTGSVVLNVACYTAVTRTWFEADWNERVWRKREIAPGHGFARAVLDRGAAAYTAYLGPRPAGPELECDVAALVAEAATVGEARRRDYDKLVLGYLADDPKGLALAPLEDGSPLPPAGDVISGLMREIGTGGILFGDPAWRPFPRTPAPGPVQVETELVGEILRVRATLGRNAAWVYGADPTTSYDGQGAPGMKLVTRVPIGDRYVAGVELVEARRTGLGAQSGSLAPARLIWALEEDQGSRFVHLKALFPRPSRPEGLSASFSVRLTGDRARACWVHADPPPAR
jgi:hypothetical protein